MSEEEEDHDAVFHSKFSQKYPVDLLFLNIKKMDDRGVRGEFFGVLLSATEDEQRAFAMELLPNDLNMENLDTLAFDIGQKLGRYGRTGPILKIVNFLIRYTNNPNKSSILSSSNEATKIEITSNIRKKMQPRIATALVPEKRGGRHRKTKKSKRRARSARDLGSRKTRRRHK
jgi:hypothetical protein